MATNRGRPGWWLALAAGLLGSVFCGAAQAAFALRDGDTVVFLGDSITAARTYGKIVENYTLLRFPGAGSASSTPGGAATRRPAGSSGSSATSSTAARRS